MQVSSYWYMAIAAVVLFCLIFFTSRDEMAMVPRMKAFYRNKKITVITTIKPKPSNAKKCNFLKNLRQIILAVNFNEPYYDNIPLVKKLYEPYFAKLVFCGSAKSDKYDVIQIPSPHGYQAYACVVKMIEMYPRQYYGYFHTNDDVLLNIWNLNGDPNKVWQSIKVGAYVYHKIGQPPSNSWWWWPTQWGALACERAFGELDKLTSSESGKKIELKKYFDHYNENTKNKRICVGCYSDAFYIPNRYADIFKYLADVFLKHKVFNEIVYPTITLFLGSQTLQENMNGMYFVDNKDPVQRTFIGSYTFNLNYSHPVKFSNKENVKYVTDKVVPEMLKRVKECE